MAITRETFLKSLKRLKDVGRKEPDLSEPQNVLQEIMGGGARNKIWGWKNQPVEINGALGDGLSETSNLFGFGNNNFPNEHETRNLFGF